MLYCYNNAAYFPYIILYLIGAFHSENQNDANIHTIHSLNLHYMAEPTDEELY